jgi:PIN domain nuclease of toxin-antitoxin system
LSALLDTHVWVWWLTPRSPITEAQRTALDEEAARGELFLSAISLWEAQMLHARERLTLPLPFGAWLRRAADERMLTVLPIDVDVILALESLPASFHGDPADRIIVATARTHALPLATHDAAIRRARVAKLWKA